MYNFEEIKAAVGGRKGYFVFTDYLEPIHEDTEVLYNKDGVFIQHNPGSEMLIKGLTDEHLKEIVESYVVDIEAPSSYDDDFDPYGDILEGYIHKDDITPAYCNIISAMVCYMNGEFTKEMLIASIMQSTDNNKDVIEHLETIL